MEGLKITVNRAVKPYDIKREEFKYTFEALQKAIDSDCIDIIHAKNLPSPYCMVVDDEFLFKNEPQINLIASYLYGTLEHGQPICGDVIIMKDKATPDGIETVGLEVTDIKAIEKLLYEDSITGICQLHEKLAERWGRK